LNAALANATWPGFWISVLVDDRQHSDLLNADTVIDGLREATEKYAASIFEHDRKWLGPLRYRLQRRSDRVEELGTQPGPLVLIPAVGCRHIVLGSASDNNSERQFPLSIRRRTSAQSSPIVSVSSSAIR